MIIVICCFKCTWVESELSNSFCVCKVDFAKKRVLKWGFLPLLYVRQRWFCIFQAFFKWCFQFVLLVDMSEKNSFSVYLNENPGSVLRNKHNISLYAVQGKKRKGRILVLCVSSPCKKCYFLFLGMLDNTSYTVKWWGGSCKLLRESILTS